MNRRDLMIAAAAAAVALPGPTWAASAEFPFAKMRMTIDGHAMAYVDQGTGTPVVFLHGNPTSSYLWRNIIPYFQTTHRVIAPDMIGMGNSGKPDIAYTYADHARHLHGLLDALDLRDAVLVLHDWGCALGFDWAMQNPDRVAAITFMEGVSLPPRMPYASYEAMGQIGDIFKAMRTPCVGEKMVLEDNFFIAELLGKRAVNTPLSADVLAHYNSYYPDAASRTPLLEWPRQVPIGGQLAYTTELTIRLGDYLVASTLPKLMLHVTPGALIPPEAAEWLKVNLTNLSAVHLGKGVHFIQEDYPDEIGAAIVDWLGTL